MDRLRLRSRRQLGHLCAPAAGWCPVPPGDASRCLGTGLVRRALSGRSEMRDTSSPPPQRARPAALRRAVILLPLIGGAAGAACAATAGAGGAPIPSASAGAVVALL